ncbi:hypothetical protein OEA41_006209 [Lepraria neglecta]|uniref:Uncharacterized protein n=1 Tax=Lepraria neglecta TaxID=209136 RepID=A0AAE0DKA4_9LECA|nr:hypothetical protein OEA41_006209 [Lepraria neglecta]
MAVVDSSTEVCNEQPALQPPPVYTSDSERSISQTSCRPLTAHRSSTSHRHSTWLADSRSLVSRPKSLSAISFTSRRSKGRRPTIGAPSDFRKVQSGRISPLRRSPSFRPLQLSIYLPGNELPELPIFWKDDIEEEDDEDDFGLKRPTQALVKSKSDPMLLRHPSSSYSIPRKPVASRSSSIDATSRFSMSSCFTLNTLNDLSTQPKSRSTDRLRSGSIERRQSVATTQEFIDALDCQFPRPPPPAALRSNSATPEPGFTIYRRASEQSLRLRTHLEERQSLEKRLPDLLEEVSPVSPALSGKLPGLSPILDRDDLDEVDDTEGPSSEKHWFQPTVHAKGRPHHQARSSSGSSTLLNLPTPLLDALRSDAETAIPVPSVTNTVSASTQSSIRNRFSQWLLKALPTATSPESITHERRASTPLSLYSLSATTQLSNTHTKQSSMSSSYWTRTSVDVEKALAPPVPGVGVAF